MHVEIRVPSFSESIQEGTLLAWTKQPGEHVEADEVLTSLETDKVVLEVTAPQAGQLEAIHHREGDVVHAGELLAELETTPALRVTTLSPPSPPGASPPPAAPSVRRLLGETGLNPSEVPATGPHGRIRRQDVLDQVARNQAAEPQGGSPPEVSEFRGEVARPRCVVPSEPRGIERVPMSRIRMRIAERLKDVQATAAMLTTFNEVDMSAIQALRARHQEAFQQRHGLKLGFMGFFVLAASRALERFAIVNASLEGDEIVYHHYCDIGIAVSSERGLVVPVLRDAGTLALADIERAIAAMAERARHDRLTLSELSGGTFTITNGGVFGSMLSTPILNSPQSAILGMHAIQARPVADNGQVVIRPMMYLALTYDHRLIDGREAVRFLVTVKEYLEDPSRLWLQL